jgi:hypothetical protein
MRIFFAMLVAPALALADQSLSYAMVGWACAHQSIAPLHAVHAIFLLATGAAVVSGRRAWRDALPGVRAMDALATRHCFLARIATAVAAFSAIAVAAMWLPTWMISPCTA